MVGGCCGTTPEHHPRHRRGGRGVQAPRAIPEPAPGACGCRASSRSTIGPDSLFVNVGERTNVTGSARFKRKLILDDDYEAALEVARDQVENGAQIIDVNMDEGMLDSEAAMTPVPEPARRRARHRARAGDDRLLEVVGDRGRAANVCRARPIVNSISLKEGEEEFLAQGPAGPALWRGGRGHGLRRAGPGRDGGAEGRDLRARLRHPDRGGRLPARGHHLRPQHLRRRHRHRGTQRLRPSRSSRRRGSIKAELPHACMCRAASPTCRSRSAATTRCARPCTRCSSTTPSRPGWTWASSTPASSGLRRPARSELRERVEDVVLNRRSDATERLLEIADAVVKGSAQA